MPKREALINLLFPLGMIIIGLIAAFIGPKVFKFFGSKKLVVVRNDLKTIAEAINNYHDVQRAYPSSLDNPRVSCIRDRYSDSSGKYIYRTNNGKFLLYSRGPDGDDDLGTVEYNPQNGKQSNGDIVFHPCE